LRLALLVTLWSPVAHAGEPCGGGTTADADVAWSGTSGSQTGLFLVGGEDFDADGAPDALVVGRSGRESTLWLASGVGSGPITAFPSLEFGEGALDDVSVTSAAFVDHLAGY
jgi:hypothetical protein